MVSGEESGSMLLYTFFYTLSKLDTNYCFNSRNHSHLGERYILFVFVLVRLLKIFEELMDHRYPGDTTMTVHI